MTATELVVIVVGLILGYWVVSLLLRAKVPAPVAPQPNADAAQPGTASSRTDAPPVWHNVLELGPSASPDEIRSAYRSLMSKYHPDKVASLGSELKALAERKSKEIGAAYRDAMRSHGLDA